jgi:acyl-CoA thioesterase-1
MFAGALRYGARWGWFNARAVAASLVLAATANAEAPRIVVLGDSLAAGYGLAAEDAFPARLEARLRAAGLAAAVVNAGVSGDTTAGGLARLDWVLGDADHVIVALGANDALRGLDPAETEANLAVIVERLEARGVRVLIAGMRAPPNMGRAYEAAFNAVFPRLAERFRVPLYPFLLDGVAAEPSLLQADGTHPNAAGADAIARRMLPLVRAWLEER